MIMFKLLFCLNILFVLILQYEGKSFERGRLKDNNNNSLEDEQATPWQHLWFPHPPNYKSNVSTETTNVSSGEKFDYKDSTGGKDANEWPDLWFPHPPNYKSAKKVKETPKDVLENNYDCDNTKYDLGVDFDPEDKRHSYNYLCLANKTDYAPNLNTSALLIEHLIPAAYEPSVKCLNETIEYSESLPTYGPYRPLAPKFGSYLYIPPQRWLHSLADGAIVLLYHPCAFVGQVDQLQNTLRGCLYRHIITPSQQLTPQRPLALLSWGKSLQMSVVDDATVVKFIKENSKMGFRQKQQKLKLSPKQYDAAILGEAHLVTDEQDSEICGFKEMR